MNTNLSILQAFYHCLDARIGHSKQFEGRQPNEYKIVNISIMINITDNECGLIARGNLKIFVTEHFSKPSNDN